MRKATNPYLPQKTRVTGFYRNSPDNFDLVLSAKLRHEPGQFVQVSLPRFGECPVSISSYSGNALELNIRQAGNVTNALSRLRPCDFAYIRGPYGKGYPMKELEGKELVLVGGGCGVAPLKGVIEYVEHHESKYAGMALFFGFRNPQEILFRKHHPRWRRKFSLSVSVDKIPAGETCYDAKEGMVTQVLEAAKLKPRGMAALLCGPPRMMSSAAAILKKKGFSEKQIYLSTERLMFCAIGKCCHCMVRGNFTCIDGPVFRLDKISAIKND